MKKNIFLPETNVFEDKSKQFFESKHASRLQQKYSSSPYEEEYKPLYHFATIGSYLCNGVSILTASTWLFSYLYSIVKDLPAPGLIASVLAAIVLILLELMQRILGAKFFRFKLQYNKIFYGIFIGAFFCAVTSTTFSFLGGFDLVKTITTPPLYQEPILEDVQVVESKYQIFIDDAQKTADNYYNRRKYKGRIATEDAKKYQQYLDKKMMYQDSLLTAINTLKQRNESKIAEAKSDYQQKLADYNIKTNSKGAGLGGIAIVSVALLYLCLWYIEHYDFKTASQYAVIVSSNHIKEKLPAIEEHSEQTDFNPLEELVKEVRLLQKSVKEMELKQTLDSPPPLPHLNGEQPDENQISTNLPQNRIGFHNKSDFKKMGVDTQKREKNACTGVYKPVQGFFG